MIRWHRVEGAKTMSLTVTLCSAIDSGGAAALVLRNLWQKGFLFDFFGKFKVGFRRTVRSCHN